MEIANQFIAIYNDQKGIARATVTAATTLDEASLNQIKAYISKNKQTACSTHCENRCGYHWGFGHQLRRQTFGYEYKE